MLKRTGIVRQHEDGSLSTTPLKDCEGRIYGLGAALERLDETFRIRHGLPAVYR